MMLICTRLARHLLPLPILCALTIAHAEATPKDAIVAVLPYTPMASEAKDEDHPKDSAEFMKEVEETMHALMQENAALQQRLNHLNTQIAFLKRTIEQSNKELEARLNMLQQPTAESTAANAHQYIDEEPAHLVVLDTTGSSAASTNIAKPIAATPTSQPAVAAMAPPAPAAVPAAPKKPAVTPPPPKAPAATPPLKKPAAASPPAPAIVPPPTNQQGQEEGNMVLWLGIGLAGLGFLLLLFVLFTRPPKKQPYTEEPTIEPEYSPPPPPPPPLVETPAFEPEQEAPEPASHEEEYQGEVDWHTNEFVEEPTVPNTAPSDVWAEDTVELSTESETQPETQEQPFVPEMDEAEGEESYVIADEELDEDDLEIPYEAPAAHQPPQPPSVPQAPDYDFSEQIEDTIGIKLDLARAYLEMKDLTSAEEILHDVIREGSSFQQKEAQMLLDTLNSMREQ